MAEWSEAVDYKKRHTIEKKKILPSLLGNSSFNVEVNKRTRLKSTTTGDERRNWKIYPHATHLAHLHRQVLSQICEREEISVV